MEREKNRAIEPLSYKSAPKTTRLLLADLIQSCLIYSSELTYFSINAFQTSSLKRVQTATLTRFDRYCVPPVCAFYYSLDREYEEFIQRMKKLCKRTQTTFLDIRSARIHYAQSSMYNTPETHRSLATFQCNIERLRDLKQIHQDLWVKRRWQNPFDWCIHSLAVRASYYLAINYFSRWICWLRIFSCFYVSWTIKYDLMDYSIENRRWISSLGSFSRCTDFAKLCQRYFPSISRCVNLALSSSAKSCLSYRWSE